VSRRGEAAAERRGALAPYENPPERSQVDAGAARPRLPSVNLFRSVALMLRREQVF